LYDGSNDLQFFSDEINRVHEFWSNSKL
jgi:hypothetical protein